MTKLGAVGLALLIPTAAAANVVAIGAGPPEPPAERRVEGRVGMLLGGSDVGDANGFSLGVSAGVGYRVGDVTLRGLFDYYRVGDGSDELMDRRGRATRVGGALRYSFASSDQDREGVGADFWGEIGVGYEHVAWSAGGILDRPSAELAIGYELDAKGERTGRARRRHIGYFMAFRTLLGQGPELDGPAMCGGPCSKATKPSRLDASMFFTFGLHWGR